MNSAMTGRGGRAIWGMVALTLLLAGCSRAATPAVPAATLAPAPSETEVAQVEPTNPPTEPAPPVDKFAIPEDPKDIDKAYVERVLEELSKGYAHATRVVARDQRVAAEAHEALSATHTPDAKASVIRDFKRVLKTQPKALSPKASAADIEVRKLLMADAECVFALVRQDLSGLVRGGSRPFLSYYYLVHAGVPAGSAMTINRSPWRIGGTAEPLPGQKEFRNPCEA